MVGKANSTAKPQVHDELDIELTDFSATSQFPFKLSISLPGGGSANVSGKAEPIKGQVISQRK